MSKGATVKNLLAGDGTLITGFDAVSEWTAEGSGVSQVSDTVNHVEGSASLKLTATVGPVYTMKTTSLDLSSATVFSLWVYVYNLGNLDYFTFYISSSASLTKYFSLPISYSRLVPGWNHLVLDPKVFTNYNGESWTNTMLRLRFRVTPKSGVSTTMGFDDLTYNFQGMAKCVITFDDNYDSTYNAAKPIMDANGQRGVCFVVTSYVGSTVSNSKMSLSQLKTLYSSGWDISDHTVNHLDLTTLSASDLDTQVNGGYSWLVANGFQRSAKFFAYPFGAGFDNAAVISKVKENHVLARSVVWGTYQALLSPTITDPNYALKDFNIFNTTPLAAVLAEIDEAINQKGLLILTLHKLVDTASQSTDYTLISDFKVISDYLASKSGSIDVVTFSDLLNTNVNVRFTTSGMSSDASGTVLTIDSTPYTYTQLQSLTYSWVPGSTHTVTASDPVPVKAEKQYRWKSWTNPGGLTANGGSGGKPGGTFTVPSSSTTVTLNYVTQYQVSFAVNPTSAGTTTPSSAGLWVNSGKLTVSAVPNTGYTFTSWSSNTGSITFASAGSASTSATIGGSGTVTANFATASNTVSITITSSKSGAGLVKVDGAAITTPATFTWIVGSTHTLQANSPVSGVSSVRYVYTGWSDGLGQTHSYTVPGASTTVTASYKTQYKLTIYISPSSLSATNIRVSPASTSRYNGRGSVYYWIDSSTTVTLTAGAISGHRFSRWSGAVSGTSTTVTVNMSGPKTVTGIYR